LRLLAVKYGEEVDCAWQKVLKLRVSSAIVRLQPCQGSHANMMEIRHAVVDIDDVTDIERGTGCGNKGWACSSW